MSNGKSRSSEFGSGSKDRKSESASGCLGTVPRTSGKYGHDKIATAREDSKRGSSASSEQWGDSAINGKVLDQLACEIEKEISYYKSHVSNLESRLNEVRKLSGELKEVNNSD